MPVPQWYFLPVIDGSLIHCHFYNKFREGKFVHVPLLVGDETNEGTEFAYNASSKPEVAQFMKNNYPRLSHEQLEAINKAYEDSKPLPKHASYFASAAGAYGDATFTCPGNIMTAARAGSFSSDLAWNYRYNVRDTTNIANGMGVPHVSNTNIVPVTMHYYLSFTRFLNPNICRYKDAPEWPGRRLKLQTSSTEMESIPRLEVER
ncbi:hypothetical protein N7530_001084 [Penicillium desertorum]|uniref:Carboxylesterase type B domain-containing protein n=1 Tax=Penicillium desertorum TaxID=1303715 RepID=A0A9W9X9U7_9EURO|nr:hypothetical protein N7530_001084 [Penicillium desertorum]